MEFFEIEYRKPVIKFENPQDRTVNNPWIKLTGFAAETAEKAIEELKDLLKSFMGYEPEIKSCKVQDRELTQAEILAKII